MVRDARSSGAQMAKATFTVKWIEGLKPGPTERWYWDQVQRGLGLRLNTKGEPWFVVQYRVKHTARRRRVALGRYGTLTLDEAKERVLAGISPRVSMARTFSPKGRRSRCGSLSMVWPTSGSICTSEQSGRHARSRTTRTYSGAICDRCSEHT